MLNSPENLQASISNGLPKKLPALASLTIRITPFVSTGEMIEITGIASARKPISFTHFKTCVTHTDKTTYLLLGKMLNSIVMLYDLRIGSLSVSQTTPYSSTTRSTRNSRTASGFSRRSIQRILFTKMNTIRGEKEVTLTIFGDTTARIPA